jgi:tetrahydromethanopterin S-methyltransferase subunit B
MCNLNDAMIEQTGSVNQMSKEEVLEMMFHQEQEEYLEQYFNDLREAMNEEYSSMEQDLAHGK